MFLRNLIVSTFAAAALTLPATATIVSTFDNDTEGWGTLNDAHSFMWTDTIGNPPGAIRATDNTAGQWWYFAASNDYLGNKSGYYGGELSWDIMLIVGTHNSGGRADVMLVGGGMSIGIDLAVSPVNGQWTSWSVTLDANEGDWRHVNQLTHGTLTSSVVSEAQFQTVMSSLTGLYIRGEYTTGPDAAALDNVMLIPGPGVLAMLSIGLMGIRSRRRS
jgi:hypothetical protein